MFGYDQSRDQKDSKYGQRKSQNQILEDIAESIRRLTKRNVNVQIYMLEFIK